MKTILISAATFLVLSYLSAHPILTCLALYFVLNAFCFWLSIIGEGELDAFTFKEFWKEIKKEPIAIPTIIFFTWIYPLCVLFDVNWQREEHLNNIWQHFFKTYFPTIKFQSPIVIQKAVDSGDKVE